MNRARVAARAAKNRPVVANMPAHLKPLNPVVVTGPVRKTRAKPGAGSGSHGYAGPWAAPAVIGGRMGAVVRDARHSHTVVRNPA